jgi:hypothetical protein
MVEYQVTEILDKSGFFTYKASTTNVCKPDEKPCVDGRWISNSREGFNIMVYFNPTNDPKILPEVTRIRLSFDAGAYPYFDPDIMRSTFVKLIGQPDQSTTTSDRWGSYDGAYIDAYISSDRSYSITLRDASKIQKEEKKKEEKKGEEK